MKNKNLVIVFTRNPELGKVKSRLASVIGKTAALNIYKILLLHTAKSIKNLTCDKAIYYSEKIRTNDIWNESYLKYKQEGEDLGIRMKNAFKKSFEKGYKNVVIIGSDLIDLTPEHINIAFEKLMYNDVVVGPAMDGGYYLLGLKKVHNQIFENKKWGTSSVLRETLRNLNGCEIEFLQELNDIDTYEDLKNNKKLKELITNDYEIKGVS